MRNALRQARAGRIVMSVDSTDLLNRRHLRDEKKDEFLLHEYPVSEVEDCNEMTFDDIVVYEHIPEVRYTEDPDNVEGCSTQRIPRLAIVTYGNGVCAALSAMERLVALGHSISVIDCPYLSSPPQQLKDIFTSSSLSSNANDDVGSKRFDRVLFADVCKEGAGMPLAGIAIELAKHGHLDMMWKIIGATPTYNPLGRTVTFLSSEDIFTASKNLLK